jgi:two-component system nitrogen regulation sensor histidine kinase NtrY
MRLRFAVSGQAAKEAAKAEAKESPNATTKEPAIETKAPESGTIEPVNTTNNETKIEAATGE